MSQAELVPIGEEDLLATLLSRAFHDDPVFSWLLPDAGVRSAKLARFFRPLVAMAQSGRGQVWSTPDRAGAAVWCAPGRWKLGFLEQVQMAPMMLRVFGKSIGRGLRMMSTMEHQHLAEPHHYLFIIGTDPAQQGRGVGASLMAPMMERCDQEGLPAYLESSNPRNLAFYRRHGFIDLSELHVADAPPVTRMRRPPRKPS